jgi:hypothetical protein
MAQKDISYYPVKPKRKLLNKNVHVTDDISIFLSLFYYITENNFFITKAEKDINNGKRQIIGCINLLKPTGHVMHQQV